ncbi:long-chain-acyl-CoA synthetase [Glaciecola petra]|uniref:Long-chain-acyl-CoA synthetase n=1 Tax=Glaciecola petra TaxID=3075602 RepID=A0ABU2ZUZ2_9ALTE|nr:long-chain-acyl-CoA synthetase [Aestuariibacter sp. P117]MDT0596458.1 long-chain-acyl-CoA synthetase [Aestuariibacter sp. P117]
MNEVIRVLKDFFAMLPMLITFKPPEDSEKTSLGLVFEKTAEAHANSTALVYENEIFQWKEFNERVNQFAHGFKSIGIERGDTVALFMENRPEFLMSLVGLNKLGATAALINTGLKGKPLTHCITVAESKKCIVGVELSDAVYDVLEQLPISIDDCLLVSDQMLPSECSAYQTSQSMINKGAVNFNELTNLMSESNLEVTKQIEAGEKAMYIFTSGTTGLPKPAVLFHRRYLSAAYPYAKLGFRAKKSDRIFLSLPLYHITGLGPGFGSSIVSGASIFLKRKFSASNFWKDVQKHQTNLFVYVGEICRYLALQPECKEEKNNPIETMLGNGLRPDIWDQFRTRFEVDRIIEIYGSSEGNAAFFNFLNKDKTIGMSTGKIMLAKYDIDNDELVKDEQGKLVEVEKGEPGLLLSKIFGRYKFDGYKNYEATNSKILHDIKKIGDRWFNTGDLVKQIDVGFAMGMPHFQFVDRTGDTFRWRAENVSTNEVGEILNTSEFVEVANVYGVPIPGAEGKAGMAAITLSNGIEFDPISFSIFVEKELPHYARPVFVRIQPQLETTGTFKLVKGNLRNQGYDINQTDDPIYVLKPKSNTYEQLDQNFHDKLRNGDGGY